MSREDGGAGLEVIPDILIGGQVAAGQTGIERATDITGTPAQQLSETGTHLGNNAFDLVQDPLAAASQGADSVQRSVSAGAHDLAITYRTVTDVASEVSAVARGAQALATAVVAAATDADVRESMVLSPMSGAAAEGSCFSTSAALLGFAISATALGVASGAAVTSYQLVESALTTQAVALAGLASTAGAVTTGSARLTRTLLVDAIQVQAAIVTPLVSGAVHVLAWRVAITTAVAGVGAVAAGGVAATVAKNLAAFAQGAATEIHRNPFTSFDPKEIAFKTGLYTWSGLRRTNFSLDELERNTGKLLDLAPPGTYEAIVSTLAAAWSLSGRSGKGTEFVRPQDVPGLDPARGVANYQENLRQRQPGLSSNYRQFRGPADLLNNAGEIDNIGGNDVGVIRVVVKTGHPPVFTVIVPSTKDWYSSSNVPNDLGGNISSMAGGQSDLLKATKSALDRTLADYGIEPKDAKVMVSGFSQGGITAARFAEEYHREYNIKEVITAGAPVAHIAVPDGITATHYENRDDQIVRRLDLSDNPKTPNRETVQGRAGGHNATDYARTAADNPLHQSHSSNEFYSIDGSDIEIKDHYVRRK